MLKKIEKSVKNTFRSTMVGGAITALRRAAADARSIEASVTLAKKFRHRGIRITPAQVTSEITSLLELLAEAPPKRILEIGTAKGGTFFLLTRVAAADAQLISIDLPEGRFGGGYTNWQGRLYQSFARERQQIHLLRRDSHARSTHDEVRGLLKSQPLDFLFIDGDHTYDGVKADYEAYSALVRPGGWIGFHDIVPGDENFVGGVPRFWQQLKPGEECREFVADWKQGGYGIGLIRKS